MKIKYEFVDGTMSEVEESIGAVIIEDRRLENPLFYDYGKLLFFIEKNIYARFLSNFSFQKYFEWRIRK